MNTHTFIGHIGNDAVVSILPSKQSVINFSVAITEKYADGQGIKHENTTWVSCAKFGEKIKVAEFLKQGTMVCITGTPSTECYQKKGGEFVAQLKCKVDTIDLLVTKLTEQKIETNGTN